MATIPVNFNNTLHRRSLKYDVLFKQQLPIGDVHLSKPSTCYHQTSYSGYPVKCVFNKDFVDFKSPLEDVKVNEAYFPIMESPDLENEHMTQWAFDSNVLLPICEYFNKCFKIHSQLSVEGNGVPDFTLSIPNSEELSNSKKLSLFVAIVVKPCNAFSDKNTSDLEMKLRLVGSKALEKSADLPKTDCDKQFLENEKRITTETDGQFNFRKGMKQLKYYLFKMKTEEAFGILTSYCHTYFVILRRDLKTKEDKLIISPVVRFCDKDALKKIAEFIQKARTTDRKLIKVEHVIISPEETRASTSYGKEKGVTKKRKRGVGGSNEEEKEAETNQRKKSAGDSKKCGQQASGDQYIMGDIIGEGRSGCVFQIFDHEGRPFAAKCIVDRCNEDIIRELQNEEEIYQKMRSLQGKVPQFHFSGYLDGWRYTLVMELLNAEPIQKRHLSDEEKAAIFAALEEIHGQGILHGDIKEENILLDRCGTRRAYFIDFAFSTESDRKEAFEQETMELRILLNMDVRHHSFSR